MNRQWQVKNMHKAFLYTFDLINRQIFVVGGKKRRKGGRRERSEKDTLAFLLSEGRAHPTSSFFRISYL
ncbi:hypothetical protein TS65_23465 [Aneurinibacillus migulanus]|uniref:Uncharacterized protein n=1 Tax=Aneurinibacillus migulanus TaxID=47500 RepID=A0A0D1W1P4_ANEMI|nr:hypothetical protein TS65_23465 [Aneurinibacillus migulanus]KON94553.1 hypothetical protein AF333_02635 [Aneurinibacillus migulanus]